MADGLERLQQMMRVFTPLELACIQDHLLLGRHIQRLPDLGNHRVIRLLPKRVVIHRVGHVKQARRAHAMIKIILLIFLSDCEKGGTMSEY